MAHKITWEPKGVYRRFNGIVTGEEILESNLTLQANPRFDEINYVLNDFTQVSDHTITLSDTNAYAVTDEIASHKKPHLKIAIVVTRKDHFELADTYCDLMKSMKYEAKISKTTDQAYRWLA